MSKIVDTFTLFCQLVQTGQIGHASGLRFPGLGEDEDAPRVGDALEQHQLDTVLETSAIEAINNRIRYLEPALTPNEHADKITETEELTIGNALADPSAISATSTKAEIAGDVPKEEREATADSPKMFERGWL